MHYRLNNIVRRHVNIFGPVVLFLIISILYAITSSAFLIAIYILEYQTNTKKSQTIYLFTALVVMIFPGFIRVCHQSTQLCKQVRILSNQNSNFGVGYKMIWTDNTAMLLIMKISNSQSHHCARWFIPTNYFENKLQPDGC